MSVLVGQVNFTSRIDGRNMPKDAEKIGRSAGASAADGFDESWTKGLDDTYTKAGQDALKRWRKNGKSDGTVYGEEINKAMKTFLAKARTDVANLRMRPGFMDEFGKKFEDAGLAARAMQNNLIELNRQGVITGQVFEAGKKQVNGWALAQRDAAIEANRTSDAVKVLKNSLAIDLAEAQHKAAIEAERFQASLYPASGTLRGMVDPLKKVNVELERNEIAFRRSAAATDHQNHSWKELPHNARQVILITAAIAAGAESIAVLGSAAGAGILALGAGIGTVIAGVGAGVAVFSVLAKEVNELPPALRSTAAQFKQLGRDFTVTRDVMASAAIKQMPATFARLSDSVKALNPSFAKLGSSVGEVFDAFSKGTAQGSAGFAELRKFINNAAKDFKPLADAAGVWGTSLLRGVNKANPMFVQLIGYIDKLGSRFDRFTKSDDFNRWIVTSMQTFTELGKLLDATGRLLNDLVTPESVARTQAFLQNLTEFMPSLTSILQVAGELDIFGLIAQALNDMGRALMPLMGPLDRLAGSLNAALGTAIQGVAVALEAVAFAAAPVASLLADIVGAIPPEVITAAAIAVTGLAVAVAGLKAASKVTGALGNIGGSADILAGKASKLGGILKGALTKAGVIGLVIGGISAAGDAFFELKRHFSGVEDVAFKAVKGNESFSKSIEAIGDRVQLSGGKLNNSWDLILKGITGRSEEAQREIQKFNPGASFAGLNIDIQKFGSALDELDPKLEALAKIDPSGATQKFTAWMNEIGASREEVGAILERMPKFQQQLKDSAAAAGVMADKQDLVTLAMSGSVTSASNMSDALKILRSNGKLAGAQVDDLSNKILGFGKANLDTRAAARDFEASILTLTESIKENGRTLDIHTAAGRANEAAVDGIAASTLKWAEDTKKQTGSQEAANKVLESGRKVLLDKLVAFGLAGDEAQAYVDKLGLIPVVANTKVGLLGVKQTEKALDNLTRDRRISVQLQLKGPSRVVVDGKLVNVGMMASGGTVNGARHAIIGEAGPEAVVPLRRPLSQVDPSVRWLSAIAQGKSAPKMAAGGVAGGGNTVTFAPGSIVVQGATDPRRTALEVANEVADRIGS